MLSFILAGLSESRAGQGGVYEAQNVDLRATEWTQNTCNDQGIINRLSFYYL